MEDGTWGKSVSYVEIDASLVVVVSGSGRK